MPGPLKEVTDVRFALSKELLNTKGRPTDRQISLSLWAV
jgi:hypothetical protein